MRAMTPIYFTPQNESIIEAELLRRQCDSYHYGFTAEHLYAIARAAEARLVELFKTNRGAYHGATVSAISRRTDPAHRHRLTFRARLERRRQGWCLVAVEEEDTNSDKPARWHLHLSSSQIRTALQHLSYRVGFCLPSQIEGELRTLPREALRINAIEKGEA